MKLGAARVIDVVCAEHRLPTSPLKVVPRGQFRGH
jgi:hypothetical protein